ncbi:FAD:protein FMN transferase [Rhodohalobacter sulfatireducens]|uniref:FAD:protein FMN transferase n=1 Tax=Rhodohalobacter sulfatireducens TaxID=2911366 RepID=A0ABS9KGH0_9BACT|nr:FAD:protein FMN transferase [Rhodohalobacter sulfatireducens]MCG2589964.1 FAD:protein FMN transferase [Rhodohalobacter sulfatireducens]
MSKTLNLYRNGFYAMATRFFVLIPELEDGSGDELFQKIKDEVNRIESRLSRFIKESEISKINREAFKADVETDDECFEILSACKYGWKMTDGAFDITLRPLMDYWKNEDNQPDETLQAVKESVGMQHVELDEENQTVGFKNENTELDLGGFGKGYALEKIKQMIESSAIKDAFISFGESSVLAMGEHPAGGAWKIGINDYTNPGNSIHEFEVSNGSVSTSSNFFLNDEGVLQNHTHIINPKTGKPHENFTAASVSARSPILAEILSTACLLLSDEKIRELMEKYDDIEIIKVDYEPEKPEVSEFKSIGE